MSKFYKPGMRYTDWSVSDYNKQRFIVEASLDTFVERQLRNLADQYIAGAKIDPIVGEIFDKFNWFMRRFERVGNISNQHFNLVFLSEIVDWYITNELGVDGCFVSYDGSVTWQ